MHADARRRTPTHARAQAVFPASTDAVILCPVMKRLVTEYGASTILGISHQEVLKLVDREEIPHVHLPSGDVRFDPDDLRRWAESYKRPIAVEVNESSSLTC